MTGAGGDEEGKEQEQMKRDGAGADEEGKEQEQEKIKRNSKR